MKFWDIKKAISCKADKREHTILREKDNLLRSTRPHFSGKFSKGIGDDDAKILVLGKCLQ
jgi:hypothetical protein